MSTRETVVEQQGASFDRVAQTYHRAAPVPPETYSQVILDELKLAPNDWLVDLGCGSGVLALSLAHRGLRVTGVDCSRALLDIAREVDVGDCVEWVQAYAEDFAPELRESGPPKVFLSYEAFHLFSRKASIVERIASNLRPGGHIAVGWCEFHWESILQEAIVRVFGEFGVDWGRWGYQECSEFVDIVDARTNLFESCRSRSFLAEETTGLDRVAAFLSSIGKAAVLPAQARRYMGERLLAVFVQTVGSHRLTGRSTYWLRYAKRRESEARSGT